MILPIHIHIPLNSVSLRHNVCSIACLSIVIFDHSLIHGFYGAIVAVGACWLLYVFCYTLLLLFTVYIT